ncbi:MAG TPA: arylsulfatase, partial [Mycobacterium sp.]|nr:arylsulfatase [Mycobacterium sp.]
DVPDGPPVDGALVAQGGRTGGWALLATDGRLTYHYNYCGLLRATISAEAPIPGGTHQVRAEFAYAGGGIGRGGDVTLYVDGEKAGSGTVKRTHPLYFSFDEGLDVGLDTAMPVFENYAEPHGRFTGTIRWAQIDLGDDDHSHLIPPEAHLQAAMTHQ